MPLLTIALFAQTAGLDANRDVVARSVSVSAVSFKGKNALRITEPAGTSSTSEDKLAILRGIEFSDGEIEVDMAGSPAGGATDSASGFVGLAFRVAQDASRFECLYLRPANGRADDQLRRNRSLQYFSFPDYPWHRLRKEAPGLYESYADLLPGEWTRVRIEVRGVKARLYVHGAPQPALIVNDLKHGLSKGSVGLWIGSGTEAHFANIRITRN